METNTGLEEMLQKQQHRLEQEQDTRMAFWGQDWHTVTFGWRSELREAGGELRGLSFRMKQDEWLMVARVTLDDIQQVAFISGADPIDCVGKLAKKIRAGTVAFCVDRYA